MLQTSFYWLAILFMVFEIHKLFYKDFIINLYYEKREELNDYGTITYDNIIILDLIYVIWTTIGCFLPDLNILFITIFILGCVPLRIKKNYWILDSIISIILLTLILLFEITGINLNFLDLF